MRIWGTLLSVLLVLSMAGVTEAKAKGKKAKGVKGKITAVAANGSSVTVDTGTKKSGVGQATTFTTTAGTSVTIDGVSGKKVTDLTVGEHVKVSASSNGAATSITVESKKAGKKKKK